MTGDSYIMFCKHLRNSATKKLEEMFQWQHEEKQDKDNN